MLQVRESRLSVLLFRVLVVLIIVAAALFVFAALSPEADLAGVFTMVDHDDSLHPFNPSRIAVVRILFWAAAAGLAAVALVLVRFRGWATTALGQAVEDFRDFAGWLGREAPLPAGASFWTLLGVFAVGAAVRFSWLDVPMRFDECDTYSYFASRNLFSVITDYTAPNNHILHNICVHYATLLFGSSPAIIRLPAFLAGLLVLPLTYFFARWVAEERAALLATALVATSPLLIRYSAEARGYTIITSIFLVLFLIAGRLVERRSPALWAAFGVLTVAGGYTIPVMIYPVAVISVWMLVSADRERRIPLLRELAACGLLSGGAAVALYAPTIARSSLESLVANRWVAAFTWPYFFEKLGLEGGRLWSASTLWLPRWCIVLLLAGLAVSLTKPAARRILAVAVGVIAIMMLAQRVVPFARVFTFLLPPLLTFAAVGWMRLLDAAAGARRAIRFAPALAALAAVYLGWLVWRGPIDRPPEEMRRDAQAHELAAELIPQLGPDKAILSHPLISDPIRYDMVRAGLSRRQLMVPEDLDYPKRLRRYARLWIVKERRWSWSRMMLDRLTDAHFSEPRLVSESELVQVYSVDKRRSYATP